MEGQKLENQPVQEQPKIEAAPSPPSIKDHSNRLAIIGLIFSFIIGFLGLILCIISMLNSKKVGEKNVIAKIGIIIGAVVGFIQIIAILISFITNIFIPLERFLFYFYPGPTTITNRNIDSLPIDSNNKIDISKANMIIKGSPAYCQPEVFDPTAYTGNVKNINLISPFTAKVYEYSCGSSHTYVIDILDSGESRSLTSHILNYSLNSDNSQLFIVRNVQLDGEWFLNREIIDIASGNVSKIPDLICMNSNLVIWQAERLIAYSKSEGSQNETSICVFEKSAKLVSMIDTNSKWQAASSDYLAEKIGLLPNEPNIFYAYSTSREKICSLLLVDITDNTKRKSIDILNRNDYPDSMDCGSPEVVFDFSNFWFSDIKIKYQIK